MPTVLFRPAFLLLVVLHAAALAQAGSAPAVRVHIPAQVEVVADPIRLGEIARIETADPQERDRLQEVSLGRAPLPGRERRLEAGWIASRIRAAGVLPERVALEAPEEISVRRAFAVVERQALEEAVRRHVAAQGGAAAHGLRIREIRVPESIVVPPGALELRVAGPKGGELLGTVPLTVIVKAAEEPERRFPAAVTVERLVPVLVARRPLGRFKPLSEEDVAVAERDAAGLPQDALARPEAVLGQRVKRPVEAGAVITSDLLEARPVVKNGDRVRIVAESAGLRITASGVARQRGAVGEMIQVVNLDSNKAVAARVVDERTVRIEF